MAEAPLRVTHLVENLERGGLERVVIDLARTQADAGHDVRVVCLFEEGLLAEELKRAGIAVHACGKRAGADRRALGRIRAHLASQRTQVLHTHNPAPHYYGAVAALLERTDRLVNTRHGMGNAPFTIRREILFRLALAGTDAVALVCRRAEGNFVRHRIVPRRKAAVVPNGIRTHAFAAPSPQARAGALRALGLDPGGFHVGIVGRLNPVKDHATLLRAMLPLAAAVPSARLVVIGGGPLQASLEALAASLGIAPHVRFLGDRDDVAALLPALDAFALASISEGYSISLLEASAAGLPIVATDVGGNGEIVQDGRTGRLVPARDPESLGRALAELAADPGKRAAWGSAARAWALAEASIGTMADRYERLYRGQAR